MEAIIVTPHIFLDSKRIVMRFGDGAFDPEIVDEDGRVAPRFQYLIGDVEWSNIDIPIQVDLILKFVDNLQSDTCSSLREIPF